MIEVVRALFPFDPALDAMEGALDAAGPDLLGCRCVHLAAIVAAYGAARAARAAALRRLGGGGRAADEIDREQRHVVGVRRRVGLLGKVEHRDHHLHRVRRRLAD